MRPDYETAGFAINIGYGRNLTAMFKIAKRVLLSWTLPALAAMASPASMAAKPAGLIHRAGEEVVFEVTGNGLSRIT